MFFFVPKKKNKKNKKEKSLWRHVVCLFPQVTVGLMYGIDLKYFSFWNAEYSFL
jgi:hypothetical protein